MSGDIYVDTEGDTRADGVIDGVDYQIASLVVNTADTYDLEGFTYEEKGNRKDLVQNGVRFVYEYTNNFLIFINVQDYIRIPKAEVFHRC